MSKIVLNTHIRGEAGVIKFAEYCNKHQPYILFREVLKSDFGIDGEIELTRINEERKIEPLGEILKVQIKSNGSDNSYIRNEKSNSFDFYPRKEDIEYWEKYKKNGIDVVLVIYDNRIDQLYAKKVDDTDLYIGKKTIHKKKRTTATISFDKKENLLSAGENDFVAKYSASFKSRVSFGVQEKLMSNFLKYDRVPRQLYAYATDFKTKKTIYEQIKQDEAPVFALHGGLVYTFVSIDRTYNTFKQKILKDELPITYAFQTILEDRLLRNRYIELLNEYIKRFLWSRKLAFERDFNRYYFRPSKDRDTMEVSFTTRKRGQESQKIVVKRYEYAKLSFYRHAALECKHTFIGSNLYLIIFPKYFFSKDGKESLDPSDITKLTNFLTSREFNNHVCDWLHFWWSYLSGGHDEIVIYEAPAYKNITQVQPTNFYTKNLRLTLNRYVQFTVDFGIPLDVKPRKIIENKDIEGYQTSLFEL